MCVHWSFSAFLPRLRVQMQTMTSTSRRVRRLQLSANPALFRRDLYPHPTSELEHMGKPHSAPAEQVLLAKQPDVVSAPANINVTVSSLPLLFSSRWHQGSDAETQRPRENSDATKSELSQKFVGLSCREGIAGPAVSAALIWVSVCRQAWLGAAGVCGPSTS